MRAFLALLAFGLAAVSALPADSKIVGGDVTTIDRYPFSVVLLYGSGNWYAHSCGGSLLNNRAILTAAHCTFRDSPNNWRSRVGSTFASSGGLVFSSNRIIEHPNYNANSQDNDVSIIHVQGTISYTNNIQPASFAGPNYNPADNQVLWVIGWGRQWSDGPVSEQLRHVQVWSVNQNTCATRYRNYHPSLIVNDNMLCSGWLDVGGRDACQGDSGGPLIHNGVIVGVTSWGIGCARADLPGVNARVSRFSSWIQTNA